LPGPAWHCQSGAGLGCPGAQLAAAARPEPENWLLPKVGRETLMRGAVRLVGYLPNPALVAEG